MMMLWILLLLLSLVSTTLSTTPILLGIDGGTESIRACAFDAQGRVVGTSCAVPYTTTHPAPGQAEQQPGDWYHALGKAVRTVVKSWPENTEIRALCLDTTCCSVVALDASMQPLRPCILWMDQRAAPQAREILKTRHDVLRINSDAQGPISAEWMLPKALWIAQQEPHVWKQAKTICEYQDYLNWKLTGRLCASACNAAARWHWHGRDCLEGTGKPLDLYNQLGIPELGDKLPQDCLAMGTLVGGLTQEAAQHLGLPVDLPVLQGGPDAFVGMVGLGCIRPGQLCLITGSSHLHCAVTDNLQTSSEIWGPYPGAPLPHINFAEGGQSSTGSILRWAQTTLFPDCSYKQLDRESSAIPPGSEGLLALETFQGARTPKTDPLARGALVGLTLSHTRGHIFRALLEAVCLGTRACIQGLEAAGHACREVVLAGGATNSDLWLQLHADVTDKTVVVCENPNAPLLGCAILAAVGVGLYDSVEEAVSNMVRVTRKIEPNPNAVQAYNEIYEKSYKKLADGLRPTFHAQDAVQKSDVVNRFRGGSSTSPFEKDTRNDVVISPSLLACDWTRIGEEVQRCLDAGATELHVDIFDGVFLNSPEAFTFGPPMVAAIRRVAGPKGILDLHMCVERPARYVETMAQAGASRFIFQLEAMRSSNDAVALCQAIVDSNMEAGISINPETPLDDLFPLLKSNAVRVVDVLAVNPGFGGQDFQYTTLERVEQLRVFRQEHNLSFQIMVDGGIKKATAGSAIEAGADILVSGSFLFGQDLKEGMTELQMVAK